MQSNITILVIAILGGMGRSWGAFVGAVIFVLLENYSSEIVARDRFNLVIGSTFLFVVLVAPNGVAGLVANIGSKRFRGFLKSFQKRFRA